MKSKQISENSAKITPKLVGAALLGAWFISAFFFSFGKVSILEPQIVYSKSLWGFLGVWVLISVIMLAYGAISPFMTRVAAFIGTLAYCLRVAFVGWDSFLAIGLCGIIFLMLWLTELDLFTWLGAVSCKTRRILTVILAILSGALILTLALIGTLSYTAEPGNSTGLYHQMLWHMTQGFTPVTTLEFGESISHFSIHFSPIFYLYLPFYAVIPSLVTLYVLQTLAVLSALFPLSMIARRKGLSNGVTLVLCLLFCLCPALIGGASGGFHEYALLLPLLLWLLWALESRKTLAVVIFSLLCLSVRETAAIYLIAIGLYRLVCEGFNKKNTFEKRDRITGISLAAGSLVYITVALILFTYLGQGTLIGRFSNITGIYNTTFTVLFRQIFMNPALVLYEILNLKKLLFALCLILPLFLLPFKSGKKSALLLLLPLLILNLLGDYPYHTRMDFPYAIGSIALLFYMAILTLAEAPKMPLHSQKVSGWLTAALCFTLIIGAYRGANESYQFEYATGEKEQISVIDTVLSAIPEDASVSASERFIPALADRKEIYTPNHSVSTDYVVIDLREEWSPVREEIDAIKEEYAAEGYVIADHREGIIILFEKGA